MGARGDGISFRVINLISHESAQRTSDISYEVEHEKRNSISTSSYALFC